MADTLKTYIDKVLEHRDRNEVDDWTEDELREVARDLGLSDDELSAIDRRVNDDVERALGFMKHQLWSEAIGAWRDVVAFVPGKENYQLKLATSLLERGEKTDFDEVREIADGVLLKNPSNSAAFELISQLKTSQGAGKSTGSQSKTAPLFIMLALTSLGVGLGVYVTMSDEDGTSVTHAPVEVISKSVATTTVQTSAGKFPITIKTPEGISVDVHQSQYDQYDDSSFYKLKGIVLNKNDFEFDSLKGQFTYTLKDGNTIQDTINILSDHEAPMRPNDSHAVTALQKISGTTLKSVVLNVLPPGGQIEVGSYPPSKAITLKYAPTVSPDAFKLQVLQRSESLGTPSTFGRYHRVSWEFTNGDGPPIRTIKVRVDYIDTSDNRVDENAFLIVYSGVPPLQSGEIRAHSTIRNLKSYDFDHYELTIVEMR